MLVPGGFGDRGVQGKILAATYARTNGVPYLGICLGMQLAVVDYARNVGYLFPFHLRNLFDILLHLLAVLALVISRKQTYLDMILGFCSMWCYALRMINETACGK